MLVAWDLPTWRPSCREYNWLQERTRSGSIWKASCDVNQITLTCQAHRLACQLSMRYFVMTLEIVTGNVLDTATDVLNGGWRLTAQAALLELSSAYQGAACPQVKLLVCQPYAGVVK
jgi:hypothetical protein